MWVAAIAGVASADGTKVTICHFPPGNPANFQQISIDAAGVPAHLAHGDFLGPCASDCNTNQTLCSTPPDWYCCTLKSKCSSTVQSQPIVEQA